MPKLLSIDIPSWAALAMALLSAVAGAGGTAALTTTQVGANKAQIEAHEARIQTIERAMVRQETLLERLPSIEEKLDRLAERGPRYGTSSTDRQR